MNKRAFLIKNIEEFGKLMAYCIQNDVSVFRTYWDERESGDRCYRIDWQEKRCYYSRKAYWVENGYEIVIPNFVFDQYGNYQIASYGGVN